MSKQEEREAWCVLKQESGRRLMLKLVQVSMISEDGGVDSRTTASSSLHDLGGLRRRRSSQRRSLLAAGRWSWHRVISLVLLLDQARQYLSELSVSSMIE